MAKAKDGEHVGMISFGASGPSILGTFCSVVGTVFIGDTRSCLADVLFIVLAGLGHPLGADEPVLFKIKHVTF